MSRELINSWLRNNRGKNPAGEPNYRVVWSGEMTEKRFGTFRDFSPSGLFIREFRGVREVPKYPYLKERWILERWIPPEYSANSEIIDSNKGTYEPLYVFEDYKGNSLPLSLKVVQFITHCCENPEHVTPEQRRDMNERIEDAEIQEFLAALDGTSVIGNALATGDAIGYTGELKNVAEY